MICFHCSISTGKSLTSLSLKIEGSSFFLFWFVFVLSVVVYEFIRERFLFVIIGLVILEVLHLYDISMRMRHRKLWIGSMVTLPATSFFLYWLWYCIDCVDNSLQLYGISLLIAGRVVDGREITVQFAKYGPNAERM